MKIFNVQYKTPVGNCGMHFGVKSCCEISARQVSAESLSVNTPWQPSDFQILNVFEVEEENTNVVY